MPQKRSAGVAVDLFPSRRKTRNLLPPGYDVT
jgi:hypothetical protein